MFEEEHRRQKRNAAILDWCLMQIALVGTIALMFVIVPPAYQFYRKTQAIALEFTTFKQDKANHQKEVEDSYTKGFEEGVKSVNIPKTCTDWWFGGTSREKQIQAQLAYCKGKL